MGKLQALFFFLLIYIAYSTIYIMSMYYFYKNQKIVLINTVFSQTTMSVILTVLITVKRICQLHYLTSKHSYTHYPRKWSIWEIFSKEKETPNPEQFTRWGEKCWYLCQLRLWIIEWWLFLENILSPFSPPWVLTDFWGRFLLSITGFTN